MDKVWRSRHTSSPMMMMMMMMRVSDSFPCCVCVCVCLCDHHHNSWPSSTDSKDHPSGQKRPAFLIVRADCTPPEAEMGVDFQVLDS
jgi:hypothetical protein